VSEPQAPPDPDAPPPKDAGLSDAPGPAVIYVMGAGRSGSTILGVALGNCEGVFFAGELDKWLTRAGEPRLRDPERTRFWDAVRAQVPAARELFGGQAHHYLERSSSLFHRTRWSAGRRLRGRYRRVMAELYRATARTAGATHVVDTSHYPLRARELQATPEIDLFLVLLVRNPKAVMASLARGDVAERRLGTASAAAYLTLTYALSTWVFLRQPRAKRMLVHHERFLADPEGVLDRLLGRAGSRATVPDLSSLRTGLPLHGNRLIKTEVVSLERR
jgi:Sulfotransferase family